MPSATPATEMLELIDASSALSDPSVITSPWVESPPKSTETLLSPRARLASPVIVNWPVVVS